MKRLILAALLVFVVTGVSACGPAATKSGSTGAAGSNTTTSTNNPPVAAPYASIATTGTQEQAAVAGLSRALASVAESATPQGKKIPDLTGAKPTLVAYVVRATLTGQAVLFEVRADGRAYELHAYPSAPDPAKLTWRPVSAGSGGSAKPADNAERAAVAAVASIVKIAAPDSKPTVRIGGFLFYWIKADGKPVTGKSGTVFSVTVDPSGDSRFFTL